MAGDRHCKGEYEGKFGRAPVMREIGVRRAKGRFGQGLVRFAPDGLVDLWSYLRPISLRCLYIGSVFSL